MDNTSDMLARIRNALKANKSTVKVIFSKKNLAILKVMEEEGYIEKAEEANVRDSLKEIVITLKYKYGIPSIRELKLRSKQRRREYSSIADLPLVRNGLGVAIISTPLGIISDYEARQKNVGGEIICEIF